MQLIDKVDVKLLGGIAPADLVLGYGGFSVVVALPRGAGGDVDVVAGRFRSCSSWRLTSQ